MPTIDSSKVKIAVVIPCYKVTKHIESVIAGLPPSIDKIYLVDDACPEHTGDFVSSRITDIRLVIIRNGVNQGVGGAVIAGYKAAFSDGIDIVLKMDGDGQMDPALIPAFLTPILEGRADYAKGNRFFVLDEIWRMPAIRIFGNAVLSFMSKLSGGYWQIFDPTNGFTAIHARLLELLPLDKINKRYFFETDMLFRLNTIGAVVCDIPMHPNYGDEVSNLKVSKVLFEFSVRHFHNFFKRIFYCYYLRDISIASFEIPIGTGLLLFGTYVGIANWSISDQGHFASSGTVMLASLPVLLGIQFLLHALNFDISNQPKDPIWPRIGSRR